MKIVTNEQVQELVADRPRKFTPEQTGYEEAPDGSAMRCAACFHLYRRATDGHAVCELIRDDDIDENGINPAFRCQYFTSDGDVFPLLADSE